MPIILAIETSSELASAALLRDGQVISRESVGVQTHSQTILPMVQSLLAEAGISLAQCDALAFGVGPGSFTGVRTACGIVQGLAFGAALPVLPVITLAAMAQACLEEYGATEVVSILDARMAEVYWAQYRHEGNAWKVIVAPTLSAPGQVLPISSATGLLACGNGLSAYADLFATATFAVNTKPVIMPHARYVAQLGLQAFEQGMGLPGVDAQPLYLRNNVALTTAERAAKAAA
ncbi:tRNA (adenosine(37)-N6)-threonylcarbamoyltransferase complex dimerization subunit type 1 TsaB [Glaciimonas immobilis]|uniref:tRNA threonylcarbamoyladenosine biosynthesis protein TsaB n=1 Tax=Glaciimonas immobilis TaxID=728004 RepID=A0A840RNS5_9BURK|nr:tRNA (adenosine(37)-N6)-threonylcarbamoyltransferase complex dimerization subunit type 1 TsaB [Glaciimonas immobilis]KAF3998971.1 tRNA (adenosine(37)-N6)-threonylcarbamoyltransferase complex dimerization subunit type 1 TsaB [Glaciimonas immobilis]MBB5198384.1 tRNA threonylcarbamoyladenosine biosynthesis protein TsaB [Glaciimonas immobilis]